jgi:hypothetical protein
MCLTFKNGCETSRCLVGDRWNNDENDIVIVVIVADIFLIVDDYVVQDDTSTHDQIENVLRVSLVRDG